MTKTASDRFVALIEWRRTKRFPKGASPRRVTDSLSGEELAYKDIPKRFYDDVIAFRHCTQKRRLEIVIACFMEAVKPRKRLRDKKPEIKSEFIAVYGYLSQRCDTMKDARDWLDDRLRRYWVPRGFIVEGKVTVVENRYGSPKKVAMK